MLSRSGYIVENKSEIKKELTVRALVNNEFGFPPKPFKVYKQPTNNVLCVPQFYGVEKFGIPSNDKRPSPVLLSPNVSFSGKLRDETSQNEAFQKGVDQGHGVLSLPCGYGKTTVALAIACHLGFRTMIIVHKEFLANQWRERIQQFCPGASIGIVQQNKIEVEHDFIIAMLQSLSQKEYKFEDFEKIGTVIVDECHMILTTVFSQGLFHLTPKYLIGLSATPFRMDGFDSLFDIFFGLFRVHRNLHKEHQVLQVNTKEKIEHTLCKYGNINWNSVIDQQSKSEQRKTMICDYCQQYPDRNILVLCKRIEQMERIHEELKSRGEYSVVFKENDITFDKNCRILLSSFQKCGTGFSFNKLNMLILGVDTKDFYLQYLGRVFRTVDVKPLIVDIVDDHPLLKSHFRARKKIYLECGGSIQRLYTD